MLSDDQLHTLESSILTKRAAESENAATTEDPYLRLCAEHIVGRFDEFLGIVRALKPYRYRLAVLNPGEDLDAWIHEHAPGAFNATMSETVAGQRFAKLFFGTDDFDQAMAFRLRWT